MPGDVCSSQARSPPELSGKYGRLNGHARPQLMSGVLPFIKTDTHRNALPNFYVVAVCILGRQQAKARARSGANGFHGATVFVPVSINFDPGFLPDSHASQLRFLEVGSCPDVVKVHDGEQRLAGLQYLSRLDAAFAEDA